MKDIAELTTHCIRCGFCLEACPTFTTTASELESPRGRIYLVRSALEGKLAWQEDVKEHLDKCLGCRACETACPSGVEYGAILEMARDKIEKEKPERAKTALLDVTTRPNLLRAQLAIGKLWPGRRIPAFVSRLVSGQHAEVDKPWPQLGALPELDETALGPIKGEVYFLEGCAMRVLYRRVNEASRRLLRRVGYRVREVRQSCCGALHAHNGHLDEAKKMAVEMAAAMNRDLPIIVNSAGCGSTMKEYGPLTDAADGCVSVAKRTMDLTEFLFAEGLSELLENSAGIRERVTYHDACHLAHGQKITRQPRELIQAIPNLDFAELGEADTCCGSAGVYNVVQPKLARQLLDRKWANVEASDARIVATGNPGCHSWIAQAAREHARRVQVVHTAELLEASFIGVEHFKEN